jgi:hypothetical protein
MKRSSRLLSSVAALVFAALLFAPAARTSAASSTVVAALKPVGNSNVSGVVTLRQLSGGGTRIHVVAVNLNPGAQYLSLYYDNHTCALEPYSAEDVIGGLYTANAGGVGTTRGTADDDLDEINSVSVRRADFTLVSCADVHPGG